MNIKDPRKFFTRLICIVLCVIMVGGLLTSALLTMVSAAGSSQLKKELYALKNEAQEIINQGIALKKQLDENSAKTQTTIDQKSAIDQQISITEAEIENANAQIQQYSLLIAEKQKELDAAMEEQEELNRKYQARLRAMEETGSISYWSILFKASSFADLLSRIDSIREVAESDQRMLEELEKIADTIKEDRIEMEAELTAQEEAKTLLAEKEDTLLTQREEADKLLKQLKIETDNLTELYKANEEAEAAARAEAMKKQREYEAQLSKEQAAALASQNKNNVAGSGSSGNVTPGTSGFSRPLDYLTVTCAYGWRIHPIYGDRRFHTGVDFGMAQGSPIYAIAAGTVTSAYYNTANGYMVTIAHGNGYGSLYGHMTHYTVSAGDSVSQGEIIGYVGSTGWSTGPHLHFEIHVNGNTVNPMDYVG